MYGEQCIVQERLRNQAVAYSSNNFIRTEAKCFRKTGIYSQTN